ncbi:MAG TPA: tetratricopeptide repeat protein [Casimicrobiaceae bacterium]|nr:tetratricopeptide repeat protein [Casimicrobiaceae bacterium]
MTPVGRNAPCPCGSGKRYKECHGMLPAAQSAAAAPGSRGMREALELQRDGQIREAAAIYRRVLAVDPANFDATHMLGLLEYEIGDYDEAVSLLRRAIELRPDIYGARHNLRLLESLPTMEVEICREALARLARVDTRFDLARLGQGGTVHVVSAFGDTERAALEPLLAACGSSPVELWREPGFDSAVPQAMRLTSVDHPRGGWVVLLGAAAPISAWIAHARAVGALLVATGDRPCDLIDRVDELTVAGCTDPGLLCATPALARRLGLPLTAALPPGATATSAVRRDAA